MAGREGPVIARLILGGRNMAITAPTRVATPIPSTGIPGTSSAGSTSTPAGNAAVGTSYSATPASSNTGGGLTAAVGGSTPATPRVTNTGGTLNVGGTQVNNAQSGQAALRQVDSFVSTQPQSPGIAGDVKNAIGALTAFAQSKMDQVQSNIKALMSSEGGEMNAAKLQVYSQELSNYETMMQMAAKLQEKEERAVSIWVRP